MTEFFVYECVFCDDAVVYFSARDEFQSPVCNLCLDFDEAMELQNLHENNAYDIFADR
jgi:hypothetical protein